LNFQHFEFYDATLFVKRIDGILIYLVVYVDDLFITGNNEDSIQHVKAQLQQGFEMTDLGPLHYYLGIEMIQKPICIFITQQKYIGDLLNKFGMTDCKPLSTPMEKKLKLSSTDSTSLIDATPYRQLVGSLIYATTTCLDISFVVGVLSRFMQQPRESHWLAAKRVL
jgi:hypothetical protein